MAAKRSAARTAAVPDAVSDAAADTVADTVPAWIHEAVGQGVKPDQALALIGLGLVQKMAATGAESTWVWSEAEDGGSADVTALRRRLELTQLALHTGAPLSTAEVTFLMGARPGSARVERGGLVARRLSRNVWKLGRVNDEGERPGNGFSDGFRRRF